ncbi:ribose-phosphate pyrophosphokinase, partial [Acinetobacter baumannii]
THGVLSANAVERVDASPLSQLVVTDSIEPTAAVLASKKVKILTTAPLLAEAIVRISQERSVSSLFG